MFVTRLVRSSYKGNKTEEEKRSEDKTSILNKTSGVSLLDAVNYLSSCTKLTSYMWGQNSANFSSMVTEHESTPLPWVSDWLTDTAPLSAQYVNENHVLSDTNYEWVTARTWFMFWRPSFANDLLRTWITFALSLNQRERESRLRTWWQVVNYVTCWEWRSRPWVTFTVQ